MHAVVPAFPLLVAFKLLFTWHNHKLTSIFSASLCQGKLPTDWKMVLWCQFIRKALTVASVSIATAKIGLNC